MSLKRIVHSSRKPEKSIAALLNIMHATHAPAADAFFLFHHAFLRIVPGTTFFTSRQSAGRCGVRSLVSCAVAVRT